MKLIIFKSAIFLLAFYLFCGTAQAQSDNAPVSQTEAPKANATPFNRTDKPFGVYLGFEDTWGSFTLNVADNIAAYLRLKGGVGVGSGMDITVYAGIEALLPHREFSPVIGLNVANDFDNGGGIEGSFPIGNYTSLTDWLYVYTNLGFDYQAKDGFNLGFGACITLGSTSIPSGGTFSFVAVPYLNVGKFF